MLFIYLEYNNLEVNKLNKGHIQICLITTE